MKILRRILIRTGIKTGISNIRFEKPFGRTFDNQLNSNHHISKISKTASNRFDALARVFTKSIKIKGNCKQYCIYYSIRK